jgi:PAS domain S-box-containing protein
MGATMKVADQGLDVLSLRTLIDSLPALIHTGRPDGYLDFLNQRWLQFVGLRLEELEGWKWTSAVHRDDVAELVARWRACLESGEPLGFEARVRRADGEYRWMLHHKVAVRDESGQIVRWYGTSTDIEDRRQAEQKLRQVLEEIRGSEANLRRTIDTIPALVSGFLPDGSNEFMNRRWHDYTGLSPERSQGRGWQRPVHPDDLPALMERFRQALATGEPGYIETRLRRHDGVFRWFVVRAEPLRDESGKVVKWYATSTDIEDRRQTEEQLRQEERELRQITDAIPQSIIVQDPDGIPIYANKALLDYAGLTIEDVSRPDFRTRIAHPEDFERLRDIRQAALSRGLPFEVEVRGRSKDGQYRWFLAFYNPFRDEQGRLVRWYVTGTDIDDRKRAEDRTRNENVALREEIDHASMFEEIVGSSDAIRRVLGQVAKVAPTDSTVLISGETGTGKELIARAIHKRSNRSARAFIRVNCGAIAAALSPPNSSDMRKAHSLEHLKGASDTSKPPTAELFFWTRSAIFPWIRRARFCACSRNGSFSELVAVNPLRSMCGYWPQPTATCDRASMRASSVRICSTVLMCFRSACRRYVNAPTTFRY